MPPPETLPNTSTTGVPPPPGPPAAGSGAFVRSEEPAAPAMAKIRSSRYGELDHSELVHLLDSLDDDRSRSRFRESIYISVIFYLALAWLVVYGPRVLFHQGRIVENASVKREKDRVTQMELNDQLRKLKTPVIPKAPPPALNHKAMEQLQAMRRANEAARPAAALPAAPQPQAQPAPAPAAATPPPPPVQAQVQPPLPAPPRPAAPAATAPAPDAPRPNFNTPSTPGQSIAEASRAAAGPSRGVRMGDSGPAARVGQQGANEGYEILSDTQGFDFSAYIKRMLRILRAAWVPLIPEECSPPLSKEGTTLIRFTIERNGVINDPHLEASTHDRAIDKAAWGSLNSVAQFPPLPAEFKGPNLELRVQFIISHNASDTE